MMNNNFAKYITEYFTIYLPKNRNLSVNTIVSYRDTMSLFLTFYEEQKKGKINKLTIEKITEELVLDFLNWLEIERKNSINTRNQRLAAIHAIFKYIQVKEPINMYNIQKILVIKKKKTASPIPVYLLKDQMALLLKQPNVNDINGRRDAVLLSLLYELGARAQEIVDLTARNVRLGSQASVTITGKGNKTREVPITEMMTKLLKKYMQEHSLLNNNKLDTPLFRNQKQGKLTRHGITYIVKKYIDLARQKDQGIPESVSPHTFRHTRAIHLVQAGIALPYIQDILGHVDISTTEIYARIDTELKRKAIEQTYLNINEAEEYPDWTKQEDIRQMLKDLSNK